MIGASNTIRDSNSLKDRGELSVTDLTRALKLQIESRFPQVSVCGEISNFTRQSSGHIYFTLKDQYSSLSCVMFRSSARNLKFDPSHGMQVVARGGVKVYEPRGQYQLQVQSMLLAGQGSLHLELERRKKHYQSLGFFQDSLKKELPFLPGKIGIITSPTGAAIRDMLQVIERRCSNGIEILHYPVKVQGVGASDEIEIALRAFMKPEHRVDVILLGRGGGSLEDLWAFNEDPVIQAVFEHQTPIISAVGHETDFTLCDFVADVRAATPSMAGELAVPDLMAVLQFVMEKRSSLQLGIQRILEHSSRDLERSSPGVILKSLEENLNRGHQDLDYLNFRFNSRLNELLSECSSRLIPFDSRHNILQLKYKKLLDNLETRLSRSHLNRLQETVESKILDRKRGLEFLEGKLNIEIELLLKKKKQDFISLIHRLRQTGPDEILRLGYAYLLRDGDLLSSMSHLKSGDQFEVILQDGRVEAEVRQVHPKDKEHE